jgi:hypothetical protein
VTLNLVRVTIVHVGKKYLLYILCVCACACVRACVCACVGARVCVRACILALIIQHAKRMRHIRLSPVACLAVPYFSTLSHKKHDCRKTFIEYKICVLIFATNFLRNICHSTRKQNSAT